jgi:RimJ/RimL family protein N-acetyltransferase/Fe-S-cluster containining protein
MPATHAQKARASPANDKPKRTTAALSDPVPIPSLHDNESRRLAARMTGLARAMSDCEGVAAFPETGWLPDRFFVLIDDLYATYDAYIAHNLAASGLKIQCRFGCTRCCRQAVHGVYAFEIVNLYRKLRPLEEYAADHDACADYADQFQSSVAQISEANDGDDRDPVMRTLEAFAAAALPCPLLAGNNCRVYAHRPAACRMYHSLTNPVYCTTSQGQTFNLEVPQETSAILWALSDRLAFPFPTFLAQGLVTFGTQRQFRPWANRSHPPEQHAEEALSVEETSNCVIPDSTVLESERLILRRLCEDDAAFILELVNDADWLRHIGDKGVRNLDDARAYIRNGPVSMYARAGFGLWRVELKADATPIGLCGLIRRDTLPDVDIGFAYLPRYRGHGYAREAASATLAYGAGIVGLRRIVAITSPENTASGRVLEDAGLRFERMFRIAGEDREVKLYAWSAE